MKLMEAAGKTLKLFEPPVSMEELAIEKATDQFKTDFLKVWQEAYQEETTNGGNAGINVISVLEQVVFLMKTDVIDSTLSFQEAYEKASEVLWTQLHG